MAYCNNCGLNIPSSERQYKRQMYSGTSHRTNYGKRITFGTSNYYSMKTVCANCASRIDESNANKSKTFLIIVIVIAIIITIFFLVK